MRNFCFFFFIIKIFFFRIFGGVTSLPENANKLTGVTGFWEQTVTLNCMEGQGLHIVDASLGTPILAEKIIYKGDSDAPHTKLVIQQMCEGHNSCQVPVRPDVFGVVDSVGTTAPSLAVVYICFEEEKEDNEAKKKKITAKKIDQGGWNIRIENPAPEFDEHEASFVHLHDLHAECDEPLRTVRTLEEAESRCSKDPICSFIAATPPSVILCKSSIYSKPQTRAGSIVYVKASRAFAGVPSNFQLYPNVQSLCERKNVIATATPVYNVKEAADICIKEGCDFFVMSTVNGLKGANKRFAHTAWMCKGDVEYIPHEGFILGEKRRIHHTSMGGFNGALPS